MGRTCVVECPSGRGGWGGGCGFQGKECPVIESFNFSGPLFPHLYNGVNALLPPLLLPPSFLSPLSHHSGP